MSRYGYLEVFQSPLEFEITRVNCRVVLTVLYYEMYHKTKRFTGTLELVNRITERSGIQVFESKVEKEQQLYFYDYVFGK